jgi:integrating conjugative element protein (TIGR03757 family)
MMQLPATLLAALMPLAATSAEAAHIDVFTTATIPVTGLTELQRDVPDMRIKVHRIDGLEAIKAQLSDNLPGDKESARRLGLKRLQQFGADDRAALQDAADGLVLAWQLELRRYPAFVVNRRWVVYGVTELGTAYALYKERRGEGGS